MRKVTRRLALGGLSGASLAAVLGDLPTAPAGEKKPAPRREFFVVGPFSLGDWFQKSKLRIEGLFNLGAPDGKEIVKSLNECTLYVLDKRVWNDAKKKRFADGGPKLVATGKLHHVWKDDGKKFTIHLSELKASSDSINYDAVPPHQRVRVSVELITMGTTSLGTSSSTISICPEDPLFYDLNGKLRRS